MNAISKPFLQRKLRLLPAALAVLCGLAAAQAARTERWYAIGIGGQKVGYLHEASGPATLPAEGRETRIEMKIILNRLGNKVEMETISTAREDGQGHLLSFGSRTKASALAVTSEGVVEDRQVRLTTAAGDKPHVRTLPFEGELLGPLGIRELTRSALAKAGDVLVYQTFSTELGQIVKAERAVLGAEAIEGSAGRPALKIRETLAGTPVERTIWIDANGDEIRSSQASPFGDILTVLADKEEALRDAGAGRLPEEQYRSSLALSNVRLPRARDLESVTLRIRHRKPELGWPGFPGPYQTVVSKTADELTLRVDRPVLPRKGPAAAAAPEDLEANAYLDARDPLIRETAKKVAGQAREPLAKAILLRNWVGRNMTFDLGIVSPPAREVIRDRRGTCVGYAMLLTSLLRAAGVPAKFLMGYVYLNGIWGGHAWTEVQVDGVWVPLDAAVMSSGIADAARFHFSRSDLAGGLAEAAMGGYQLYGFIDIDVVEYRLAGRTVRVAPGQKIYEASGDAYRNPGLGLTVSKPAGFIFAELNKTWPDSTLLKMTGPEGAAVTIFQERADPAEEPRAAALRALEAKTGQGVQVEGRALRRTLYRLTSAAKAGAAFFDGPDLWVLVAEGPEAGKLLEAALSRLSLKPPAGRPTR
jgi:hypothetical protein